LRPARRCRSTIAVRRGTLVTYFFMFESGGSPCSPARGLGPRGGLRRRRQEWLARLECGIEANPDTVEKNRKALENAGTEFNRASEFGSCYRFLVRDSPSRRATQPSEVHTDSLMGSEGEDAR
jgi:hypothetical protein